jgi:hypothetical protein
MFRDAYEKARAFTRPVVQFGLTVEGKCTAGAAAFVVVNSDGWFVTAAHVIKSIADCIKSDCDARAWEKERDNIKADSTPSTGQRDKKLKSLGSPHKKAVRRATAIWSFPATVVDVALLEPADIAVGRLEGFRKEWVTRYPVFKDPTKNFRPGASLCKLGYPFIEFTPSYDETNSNFSLPPEQQNITFFPIEGIFTREIIVPPPSPAPSPGAARPKRRAYL